MTKHTTSGGIPAISFRSPTTGTYYSVRPTHEGFCAVWERRPNGQSRSATQRVGHSKGGVDYFTLDGSQGLQRIFVDLPASRLFPDLDLDLVATAARSHHRGTEPL